MTTSPILGPSSSLTLVYKNILISWLTQSSFVFFLKLIKIYEASPIYLLSLLTNGLKGDFTPVCTTELGAMGKYAHEFEQRGVKLLGLSCWWRPNIRTRLPRRLTGNQMNRLLSHQLCQTKRLISCFLRVSRLPNFRPRKATYVSPMSLERPKRKKLVMLSECIV